MYYFDLNSGTVIGLVVLLYLYLYFSKTTKKQNQQELEKQNETLYSKYPNWDSNQSPFYE